MTKHSGLTILLFIFFFFLYDLKQPQRLEKLDKTVFDFLPTQRTFTFSYRSTDASLSSLSLLEIAKWFACSHKWLKERKRERERDVNLRK